LIHTMPCLAVIIPMHNEEANAERCVRAVCDVLLKTAPSLRLFVIDNASSDSTGTILHRLDSEGLPLTTLHESEKGYGAAVRAGLRCALASGFDFGLVMDSDLTNDPTLIPEFLRAVATDRYDVVKASRYIPGGGMEGVPFHRQLVTIVGNWLAARLFAMGIKDCTNGFRAVRLRLACGQDLIEPGFPSILEELLALKRSGACAVEIPYVLHARKRNEGRSKFTYSSAVVLRYLKYALLAAAVPSRKRIP
jgi:dolichol-phosphate mannosyltransferase